MAFIPRSWYAFFTKEDNAMHTVETINFIIICLFFACYMYQFLYIPIAWTAKKKPSALPVPHRFAVLIAARNEEAVIGNLIDSIEEQSYPRQLIKIFVAADNCTDATAHIARMHGAQVYERRDLSRRGKGYALDFLLREIALHEDEYFDGYLVLDADNVLDRDFILHMNETFSAGHDIVTCYRNSKNYGDNWISAGYALWFLRESRYLNGARYTIGSSCAVSGTGFAFTREILDRIGSWHFFLLTEDIEFTIDNVVHGEKIGYCREAVLYDEQPTDFRQSWRQRLRWSRGYLQVFGRYGLDLMKGMFGGSFSCYDMAMNIMPAAVLSCVSIVVNVAAAIQTFLAGGDLSGLLLSVAQLVANLYLTLFALGAITTVSEWRQIHCSSFKKVLYAFTFPLFMLTYLPIVVVSLFVSPGWKPIAHRRACTVRQIMSIK